MKQDGILEFFDGANSPSTTPKGSCLSKKDEDAEVSTQSLYVVRDGFFVKTDENELRAHQQVGDCQSGFR